MNAELQAYEVFLQAEAQHGQHYEYLALTLLYSIERAQALFKIGKPDEALGELETARAHYERLTAA